MASRLLPAYEKLVDLVIETASPEEILAFQLSDEEQEHAIDLMERNQEGTLTPEEMAELDQMRQLNRFVLLLKSRARRMLNDV